jgi:hypothetical protein
MYIAQVYNDTSSWIKNYYPNGFINLRLIAEIPANLTAPPIRGDVTPPAIGNTVTVPSVPTISDDVNVSATITDDITGVKGATLYYSNSGGANWTGASMALVEMSTYKATIPKQAKGTVVQYYINASDIALNTAESNITSYTVLDLPKYSLTISVQPPEGGTTNPPVGTGSHIEGENVTVTISVAGGYELDHWELDGVNVSQDTTYTATMYANHTLTAYVKTKSGIPIEFMVAGALVAIAVIAIAVYLIKKKR